MTDPAIRIVSLTVTEGGYFLDPASGGFVADHPDIRHDAGRPHAPRTAFGAMIAALRHRRDRGVGPFTVLSCDNLQSNGDRTRQSLLSLARMSDPGLADWIAGSCACPNSMVDCIVPATGPRERALAASFGIDDACPVTHESFRQWVVEDAFCADRPPLEEAGVTFSTRVADHEALKLRILNGGHQIIAGPGDLLGCRTIAEAMAHPLIRQLLQRIVTDEIAPHLAAVPGCQPAEYLDLVARRFRNAKLQDTTRRVAFDGSSRQPGFIVPSIREGLAQGAPVDGLALVSAMWSRYCFGVREDGSRIADNDPNWQSLQIRAQAARADPAAWLGMAGIYGDLGRHPRFRAGFSRWLGMLYDKGIARTIRTYLAGRP